MDEDVDDFDFFCFDIVVDLVEAGLFVVVESDEVMLVCGLNVEKPLVLFSLKLNE